jgi:NADPH:quinone reductase-like Zn-dependent oxidoreductase
MKAICIHQFGGPEELKYEEMEVPSINPDEVLVRVYASGVNPIDWKIRGGERKSIVLPLVPGWDFSGVVEKTGSQVTAFKAGDEVYGRPDTSRNGTYTEYLAVRAGEIALKPSSIDHKAASGVALAGLTAWQGLFDHGQLQAGQRVLIHGASGGVGTFAIQFARWKGAYVIGTASGKNALFLEELGADEVINYETDDFSQKLNDIDVVLDTRGGKVQADSLKVLKPGGVLVSTVGIDNENAVKAKGIRGIKYMAQSFPNQLQQIAGLIDAGKVIPVISTIFPLKDAAAAHRLGEEGHTRGKIVLEVQC